jgi:hypothetical protein
MARFCVSMPARDHADEHEPVVAGVIPRSEEFARSVARIRVRPYTKILREFYSSCAV